MKAPDKKTLFGSARLDEITEPLRAGRSNVLMPFSTRLRYTTLQRLKQAGHALGFTEQEFVDAAVAAALDRLPEADRPLPPVKQAALDKKLRDR